MPKNKQQEAQEKRLQKNIRQAKKTRGKKCGQRLTPRHRRCSKMENL